MLEKLSLSYEIRTDLSISKSYPASKHDFSKFFVRVEIYKSFLKSKFYSEKYLSIMTVKGYEGPSTYISAILPEKNTYQVSFKNLKTKEYVHAELSGKTFMED